MKKIILLLSLTLCISVPTRNMHARNMHADAQTIGGLTAFALGGYTSWYCYAKYKACDEACEKIDSKNLEELEALEHKRKLWGLGALAAGFVTATGGTVCAWGINDLIKQSSSIDVKKGGGFIAILLGGLASWHCYTKYKACDEACKKIDSKNLEELLEELEALQHTQKLWGLGALGSGLIAATGGACFIWGVKDQEQLFQQQKQEQLELHREQQQQQQEQQQELQQELRRQHEEQLQQLLQRAYPNDENQQQVGLNQIRLQELQRLEQLQQLQQQQQLETRLQQFQQNDLQEEQFKRRTNDIKALLDLVRLGLVIH